MRLGLGLGVTLFARPTPVVIVPPAGGTAPDRYSVMGTGYRWPTQGLSNATNRYMAVEWFFGTPDYATTDPRVFCPSFWNSSTAEVYMDSAASILIEGWSIETAANVWTPCDGAGEAGVATIVPSRAGEWLPKVPAALTPNTMYRARMTFVVSATGVSIPRHTINTNGAVAGFERHEGNTSTRIARLTTTGANLSNSGGVLYKPSAMMAKGGDGRPAVLILGDSIGYGASDSQSPRTFSDRNEFGYVARGLDSNQGAKRLAYSNSCIPGQSAVGALSGWEDPAKWAGKRAAFQQARDANGSWPFDEILNQHITNSVPYGGDGGNLRIGFGRYYDLLISSYGKPIYQMEGLPSTTSTDGYQTLANQTAAGGYAYPSNNPGHMWPFNADVGGPDGLGDASAYYRAQGKIAGSFAPWRAMSADTGANRYRVGVRAFATTVASAYSSGASVSLTDAPPIGSSLNVLLNSGSYGTQRIVTAVTGSGPYTVTMTGDLGGAAAAGNKVQETWGDNLHPSAVVHQLLIASIVAWKQARGFTA